MKKIILCGGGTAGHVTPNLALIPRLRKQFDEIHYVGSIGGIERDLAESKVDYYHELPCVKLIRSLTPRNLALPFSLLRSVRLARRLLDEIEPDVIFSKGGYVSLPVCLAVKKEKLILHESDCSLGLANKLAAKKCRKLLCSFPIEHKKAMLVGSPIRDEVFCGDGEVAKAMCGLYAPLPYLLITGGSSGSVAINDAVVGCLDKLTKKYNVIHVCGKGKSSGIKAPNYYEIEFTPYIAHFFALADVVVSRGGANTLFELCALGKPTLVVPLPKSRSSRGDQEDNARYFCGKKCIEVLPQSQLGRLETAVDNVFNHRHELKRAMTESGLSSANDKIADILYRCSL